MNNPKADNHEHAKDHRLPIILGCSNPSWMQGGLDYVFQLEQMSLWLPCVLNMLDLADIVSEGWSGSKLFIVREMSDMERFHSLLYGAPSHSSKSMETGHENPDFDLRTSDTIDVVNRVSFDDFVLGGYKLKSR